MTIPLVWLAFHEPGVFLGMLAFWFFISDAR